MKQPKRFRKVTTRQFDALSFYKIAFFLQSLYLAIVIISIATFTKKYSMLLIIPVILAYFLVEKAIYTEKEVYYEEIK